MSAFIDENSPFSDVNGKPVVDGFLYIGLKGANPKTNLISIFSDRELTVALANPQTLDSLGRSTNKIWIPGEYSYVAENQNSVQNYIDLDAGELSATGVTSLTNVQGTNIITAEAVPPIITYNNLDKQLFVFTVINPNTESVTLDLGPGADPITKNHNLNILPGEFETDQVVIVVRNNEDSTFEWVNHNNKVVDFYEGTDVASAATIDVWAIDGNTIHVTGTSPITSFGTAPNIGAERTLIFDDAVPLTNSVNLNIAGQADYTTRAGDIVKVRAETLTEIKVEVFSRNINLAAPNDTGQNVLAHYEGLVNQFVTVSTVDINADAVLLKTVDGIAFRVESVDVTVDITVSGINGLDTGSEAVDTWYNLWVIFDGTNIDGLLSISSTISGLTLPSGYFLAGLVGAVFNNPSSDFNDFQQVGNNSVFEDVIALSAASSGTIIPIDLSSIIPPIAKKVFGSIFIAASNNGQAGLGTVYSNVNALGETGVRSRNQVTGLEGSGFSLAIIESQTMYFDTSPSDDLDVRISGLEF